MFNLTKEQEKQAKLYAGITVLGMAVMIGICGLERALSGALLAACLIMAVTWVNRQDKTTRKTARLAVLGAILVCLFSLLYSPPVMGVNVTPSQSDTQIYWVITDGAAPYDVWMNAEFLYQDYPGGLVLTGTEPGKQYYMTVFDANNDTATASITAAYYTFPIEIWILISLMLVLLALSFIVPYAAFGAAAVGGIILVVVAPNDLFDTWLRIVAALLFVVSLGGLFINGVEN